MKRYTLLCAIGAVASVPAFASDADVHRIYVSPMVGAFHADSDRPEKHSSVIGGMAIGQHVTEAWSAEVLLNQTRLKGRSGAPDVRLFGASLELLRVFNRPGTFAPYVGAGVGVVDHRVSSAGSQSDAMGEVGVGAFWTLWEGDKGSFALRPDFKARWDDSHAAGRLLDYIAQLGFQYAWGAAPRRASVPTPPPPPPPPVAVAPAPPPPAAAPGDEDHDGVTDDHDRCPGTPPGVAVDANGCTQRGSITLEGVNFEYNLATLTPSSLSILDGVAASLQKYPRLKVELQGHTDSRGPDAYNLKLSQRRAEAVRAYLLTRGVAATQMSAMGYGESEPIADNATDAGRAKNRRVVMLVLENPGNVDVKGASHVE